MTATEELRRLLDERGVEWDYGIAGATTTSFSVNGINLTFTPMRDGLVCSTILTPAQAIAATLGAGECTLESAHGYCDPYVRTAYQIELSCHTLDAWDDPVPPSYCPYCGKRVVEEDA